MMAPEPAVRPIGSGDIGGDARVETEMAGAPSGRRPLHSDVVIAIVILAFCGLAWALTMTFEEMPAALMQGMGPAAFPRLILGVIGLLALWLAWSSSGRDDPARETVDRYVYFTVAAVLAFMAVLTVLGMYAAILFACIGIGRLWGERRLWLLAAVGAGLVATTYLFFVVAFKIPLPRALIETWLT